MELPANKRTDGVPTMGMMSVVGIAMGLLVSLLGHQPGLARVACAVCMLIGLGVCLAIMISVDKRIGKPVIDDIGGGLVLVTVPVGIALWGLSVPAGWLWGIVGVLGMAGVVLFAVNAPPRSRPNGPWV